MDETRPALDSRLNRGGPHSHRAGVDAGLELPPRLGRLWIVADRLRNQVNFLDGLRKAGL
jgi:hypothetical protein